MEKSKQLLHPTEATLALADGQTSEILGTVTVSLRLHGSRMHASGFVPALGTNSDIIRSLQLQTLLRDLLNNQYLLLRSASKPYVRVVKNTLVMVNTAVA